MFPSLLSFQKSTSLNQRESNKVNDQSVRECSNKSIETLDSISSCSSIYNFPLHFEGHLQRKVIGIEKKHGRAPTKLVMSKLSTMEAKDENSDSADFERESIITDKDEQRDKFLLIDGG
jgi:hypothetical protein